MDEYQIMTGASELVCKSFDLEPLPAGLPATSGDVLRELRIMLTARIMELLETNYEKLLSALYLIDVSEEKSRAAFQQKTNADVAVALADLIIERHMEKAKTRLERRQASQEL